METLLVSLATLAGAGLMKLWNKHQASLPFLDRAIHAAFESALSLVGPASKAEAHHMFRLLFDSAWSASGNQLSAVAIARADALFDALWEHASAEAGRRAQAALEKAGRQGEAFVRELEKKLAKLPKPGPDGWVHVTF